MTAGAAGVEDAGSGLQLSVVMREQADVIPTAFVAGH